jgi:hypothetical protein
MADIIDFLEARIAEDEAAVREQSPGPPNECGSESAAPLFGRARVLAECAAKRKILANVPLVADIPAQVGGTSTYVLMCLASVYSQHPDYQAGWALDASIGEPGVAGAEPGQSVQHA